MAENLDSLFIDDKRAGSLPNKLVEQILLANERSVFFGFLSKFFAALLLVHLS
jgi:hypothetical protein